MQTHDGIASSCAGGYGASNAALLDSFSQLILKIIFASSLYY